MTNTTPAPIGADAAVAQLRHLYRNLTEGGVRDTAQAKRIAEGLLAPAIVQLERAALASAAQPAAAITEQDAHDMGAKGAPATEAERLLFEAWMRGHCWGLGATWNGKEYRSDCEHPGYADPIAMGTRQLWAAWRDRAALAAAPKAAPAQSEWPLLEHEAALHEDGTARFGPGVSAKLLVEAAYRNAERTKERQQMTGKQRQEEERKRRALWDMVHGAPAELPEWWNKFIQGVCEIADRSSPEDEPDAIVATPDELAACALNAIENDRASRGQAPAPTTQAAPQPPASAAHEPNAWQAYAEHLEWCRTCAEDSVGACHEGAQLKVKAMAAPAAQGDALDAERYRWLRRGQRWSVIDGIGDTLRGDELDAAIDAARAAKEGDKP